MSKKLPIFYSAFLLTAVNLLLRMVSTSFQVYVSGQIGAAGVGLLQLVMSVGGLAMTAGMAGIRTAAMYLTAEELGRKKPGHVIWVLSGCFLYSIVCSCSVSALLYHFAPYLARVWIGDLRTMQSIRLLAMFLPVSCLCGVMSGYFTAANRIGTLAAVEVADQLCSMGATMGLLIYWAGNDPAKACQSVVLGGGISSCVTLSALVILRLREHCRKSARMPIGRRLLRTAVPLAMADNLKSGISTAENLMVPKRLALHPMTQDSLASFGILCGMVFPVLMFPACILFGLAELLIPELARCNAAGSRKRICYLAMRSLRLAVLYGCLCGGLLYLGAEGLCMAFYHNSQAGAYLRRFAILAPMLYCDAITDAMTKGLGQQKACVRHNIVTSFLDIVFLYLLLPKYGMEGYFFSFLVTHLLNFMLSLRTLLKLTGKVLSGRTIFLSLMSSAVSLLGASTLSSPAAACMAYSLLLGSILCLLGVIRREDLLWLRGLVRKK